MKDDIIHCCFNDSAMFSNLFWLLLITWRTTSAYSDNQLSVMILQRQQTNIEICTWYLKWRWQLFLFVTDENTAVMIAGLLFCISFIVFLMPPEHCDSIKENSSKHILLTSDEENARTWPTVQIGFSQPGKVNILKYNKDFREIKTLSIYSTNTWLKVLLWKQCIKIRMDIFLSFFFIYVDLKVLYMAINVWSPHIHHAEHQILIMVSVLLPALLNASLSHAWPATKLINPQRTIKTQHVQRQATFIRQVLGIKVSHSNSISVNTLPH